MEAPNGAVTGDYSSRFFGRDALLHPFLHARELQLPAGNFLTGYYFGFFGRVPDIDKGSVLNAIYKKCHSNHFQKASSLVNARTWKTQP